METGKMQNSGLKISILLSVLFSMNLLNAFEVQKPVFSYKDLLERSVMEFIRSKRASDRTNFRQYSDPKNTNSQAVFLDAPVEKFIVPNSVKLALDKERSAVTVDMKVNVGSYSNCSTSSIYTIDLKKAIGSILVEQILGKESGALAEGYRQALVSGLLQNKPAGSVALKSMSLKNDDVIVKMDIKRDYFLKYKRLFHPEIVRIGLFVTNEKMGNDLNSFSREFRDDILLRLNQWGLTNVRSLASSDISKIDCDYFISCRLLPSQLFAAHLMGTDLLSYRTSGSFVIQSTLNMKIKDRGDAASGGVDINKLAASQKSTVKMADELAVDICNKLVTVLINDEAK